MVATTVFERGFAQLQWMAANPIAIYFQEKGHLLISYNKLSRTCQVGDELSLMIFPDF